MYWKMTLLIACVIPGLGFCFGRSVSALGAVNPNSTTPTSISSLKSFGAAPTALPASQATSLSEADGQSAAASSVRASASISLSSAALSQLAAAASSQAIAAASNSTNSGSEVGIFAQVIIAIGVLPIEVLIVTIVLGIHRLMHRKPSRPLRTRADITKPKRDSLPYLQPKAELEDEQRRRHELHGEHLVHELDGKDEIYQMPDETDSLVLPLQGRPGIHEMPEGSHVSWEMPLQGRHKVMGCGNAQELGSPAQKRNESIRVERPQELESSVRSRNEPMVLESAQELGSSVVASDKVENAQGLAAPVEDPVTDSTHVNPSRSHFMLRQQQMLDIVVVTATAQNDASEA